MNPDWQFRLCPICQVDDSEQVVSAPLIAENMSFNDVRSYWTGFVRKPCFFTYYRCNICHLLYNKYYFTESQLNILYRDMTDNTDGVNPQILDKTNSGYIDFVSRVISKVKIKNYLELGPDIGLFAKPFIDLFNPYQVSYIEPNLSVHNILKNNSSKASEIVILNDIDELESQKRKVNFQIISGIHVFDHLISPLKYLSKLDIFVESGSYIYSVTHNERSLLRQLMRKHWIPFCLQHPQLYNPKTLEFLFGKLGFELVSCKPTVNWFPINHILTVFTRLLSSKIKVENNLFDYSIPIKLGNIQAIFRKK